MVTESDLRLSSIAAQQKLAEYSSIIICRSSSCCHAFVVTNAVAIYKNNTTRKIQPHDHSNNTSCSVFLLFSSMICTTTTATVIVASVIIEYVCLTVLLGFLRSSRVSFLLLSIIASENIFTYHDILYYQFIFIYSYRVPYSLI